MASAGLPQLARKERRSPASLGAGHLLRRALRHDGATRAACTWPDINHPVRLCDRTHIVLDHHHGVASLHQPLQLRQQPVRVRCMKAGGGLIQHIQRASALAALQLGRQLDALCLTA